MLIEKIDNLSYSFLLRNIDIMPKRVIKFVAHYYTDARVRKLYWSKLGVHMGRNTYPNLGFEATSNGRQLVYIGNHVSIGPNVMIICDSCANNGKRINRISEVRERFTKTQVVYIEDDVWIGAGVIILPGVWVGTCSVIGAGSVVTKNVEPYSVYVGSPARKVKSLKK